MPSTAAPNLVGPPLGAHQEPYRAPQGQTIPLPKKNLFFNKLGFSGPRDGGLAYPPLALGLASRSSQGQ